MNIRWMKDDEIYEVNFNLFSISKFIKMGYKNPNIPVIISFIEILIEYDIVIF